MYKVNEMSSLVKERHFAVHALSQYWSRNEEFIINLPIPEAKTNDSEPLPPQLETVVLPEWAEEISVNGGILVPSHFVVRGEGPRWTLTDWFGVVNMPAVFVKQSGFLRVLVTRTAGTDRNARKYTRCRGEEAVRGLLTLIGENW